MNTEARTEVQNRIEVAAQQFAAVVSSPVKACLGVFDTREEAEQALVVFSVSVGNVEGDAYPVLKRA